MKPAEIRELSAEDLQAKLKDARQELFNLRFQMATSQLDNTARVRQVKKDIARIQTEMRARRLGPCLPFTGLDRGHERGQLLGHLQHQTEHRIRLRAKARCLQQAAPRHLPPDARRPRRRCGGWGSRRKSNGHGKRRAW